MGVVENVVGSVVLIMLLLISGLIYLAAFAHNTQFNEGVKLDIFYDDSRINDLNTVLKITEPTSGRSMGVLLADAVFFRSEVQKFGNKSVNVTNRTTDLLRMSFGTNKYYMVVKPRIVKVSLNFIIDGSDSLSDERTFLAGNLKGILSKIEAKLNETNRGYQNSPGSTDVLATVYILSSKTQKCDLFNNLHDNRIECITIDDKDLYLQNGSVNSSSDFINNTLFNTEAFQKRYNMTPPFGFAWFNGTYYANPAYYYESDYGYGTGFASNFDKKTTLSKLTLLFPMSDELSTSSYADECFYINNSEWPSFLECQLCRDDCPVSRSMKSVEKAIEIAKDNNHIINPIYSYSCDFDYLIPDYNIGYDKFFGNPPGTTSNACQDSNCPGCELTGPNPTDPMCLHPECAGDIIDEMELMANDTGGEVINLADIGSMDINITDTINKNIDQYTLEIGEMNRSIERDVIQTSQPLPNGQLVDITLWVYKN